MTWQGAKVAPLSADTDHGNDYAHKVPFEGLMELACPALINSSSGEAGPVGARLQGGREGGEGGERGGRGGGGREGGVVSAGMRRVCQLQLP